jgi:osmoprotectant transport system ATP-binding protein
MQQGGYLAQYAPPAELLANPANDFVARFVGSDRGLKRLALITVAEVDLREAATARVGEPVHAALARAAEAQYILLLDRDGRPEGWVNARRLRPDGTLDSEAADPSSPLFTPGTTLRDALSMLLASAVQTGVVVDESGRYVGALTLEAVGAALRGATTPPPEALTIGSPSAPDDGHAAR